jgi:hypothetical protein
MVCYVDFLAKIGSKWEKGSTEVAPIIGERLRSENILVYEQGIRGFSPVARGHLQRHDKCPDKLIYFDHRTLLVLDVRGPFEKRSKV